MNRLGKRFISFVCGDRSTQTGLRLWDKLKDLLVGSFATDHWRSYEEFIPPEQHRQTKAETFTVEGYNSRIRHYLARFKRKTKCYSKSEEMIDLSLKLRMEKLERFQIWSGMALLIPPSPQPSPRGRGDNILTVIASKANQNTL